MSRKRSDKLKSKQTTTHDELYNYFDYHDPADYPNLEYIDDDDYTYQPDLLFSQRLQAHPSYHYESMPYDSSYDYPLFQKPPADDDTLENFLAKHSGKPLPNLFAVAPLPDDMDRKIALLADRCKNQVSNKLVPCNTAVEEEIIHMDEVAEEYHPQPVHQVPVVAYAQQEELDDIWEYTVPIVHYHHSEISAVTYHHVPEAHQSLEKSNPGLPYTRQGYAYALKKSSSSLEKSGKLDLSLEKSLDIYGTLRVLPHVSRSLKKIRSYLGGSVIRRVDDLASDLTPARTEALLQLDTCHIVAKRSLSMLPMDISLLQAQNGEEVRLHGAAAA